MIPKFDPYYINLHSSFLVFDKYVEFLKNEYLNGFILLEGNDKKAYMFMYEGEPQNCLMHVKSRYKKITPHDFTDAITPETFISTYRCRPEQVDFFSRAHTAKMVYNNLSSDIINPAKLINRCMADHFTGYIEAGPEFIKNRMYIYFYEGKIIGTLNMGDTDGIFENPADRSVIEEKIQETNINLYKLSPDVRDPKKDREKLIRCYEEIFNMLEDRSEGKDFSTIWRKSALELSDKFVFLDPFAGEFNYKYRQIDLWEKINIKPAIHGIDELVNRVAKQIAVSGEEIAAVKKNHIEILAEYEIR